MARNANFYNLQSLRRYPLADSATGTGDNGERLPNSILVDCALRFPNTAGRYAYLGGITVTEHLVTLVFLGADDAADTSGFVPLAAVSLPQPVVPYQHYPITPLLPGVGGWVVFGPGIEEAFTGRFATPAQSILLPRCAQAYRPLPVSSLGKLFHAAALTGLVNLKAGPDIEISVETLTIEDREREALVFRMTQEVSGRNTLALYAGPCGARPESGTCQKPGIEFINTVAPDCNGNLNILFEGSGLTSAIYADCGGVAIDHELGLGDVCESIVPAADTYTDLCGPALSSASSADANDGDDGDPGDSGDSASSVIAECHDLPYYETFDAGAGYFMVEVGDFEVADLTPPPTEDDQEAQSCSRSSSSSSSAAASFAYHATSGASRNVSLFDDCGYTSSLGKRCTVVMMGGNEYPQRNCGIVINYLTADPLTNPHIEYFLALLDFNVRKSRLLRYTGVGFIEEYASSVLPLVTGHWYRMVVTTADLGGGQVAIDVTVSAEPGTYLPTTSFTVTTTKYDDASGKFGVGSINASAFFDWFLLEEV